MYASSAAAWLACAAVLQPVLAAVRAEHLLSGPAAAVNKLKTRQHWCPDSPKPLLGV